jgi:radical SAM protein with 4Fe4S-binding SPASM domain
MEIQLPEEIGGHPNSVTWSFSDWMEQLSRTYGTRWDEYRKSFSRTNNKFTAESESSILKSPITITLELVNRCNLKCVMCWTDNHSMKKGELSVDKIAGFLNKFRDSGTPIPAVIVGLGSEPLLYREVKEVISACKEAGVMDIFFGTNAVLLDEDLSRFLIENEVTRLEVSLDAATESTYKKIRSKDKLALVESNIKKFIEIRNSMGKKIPVVRLAFVVQEFNYHERKLFLEKWSGVVDYVDFQQMSDFSSVSSRLGKDLAFYLFDDETDEEKKKLTDALRDKLQVQQGSAGAELFCPYPFNSLNVWANGDISPCCCFHGRALTIGNVSDKNLEDVWRGREMQALRQEILDGRLNRVCRSCLDRDTRHRDNVSPD